MNDAEPNTLLLTTLYAYRLRYGAPRVECVFGPHEIPMGMLVIENFTGPLVSVCEFHHAEASQAITAKLHEEDEAADPKLYAERHGVSNVPA